MSNILKSIIATVLLSLCFTSSFSQEKYASSYEKKGDKAFSKGNYSEALEYYTIGRRFLIKPLSLMYKCGEACRMLKDYDKAEYWYQKVLIENDTLNINEVFPMLYLNLAQVAKSNGNLIQAQHFLNTCLLDCGDIKIRKQCKHELESIRWIFDNETPEENTLITNLGGNVNDSFSQSGSFILNDSVLFFTSPVYKEVHDRGNTYYSDVYNKIFLSFIDEDFYTPARELDIPEVNKKKNNSSNFFFDTVTQTIWFNRCTTKNGKENCQIWYTVKKNDKWTKAKPFEPLYDKKSSSLCPVVARNEDDGKTLMYFSSNMAGGFGGFDIWYIDLTSEMPVPVNLGSTINTSGDEVTPHYCDDEQTLYFSSDKHFGFGGFDIFRSEGWLQRWTTPENLLTPVNSPANDLYPFVSESGERGYFTSNRKTDNTSGNKTCCNDLYRWDKQLPEVATIQQVKEKEAFNPAFDLPIALYFHNDEPNPNTTDSITTMDYEQCYKSYRALSNLYKARASYGRSDSLEDVAISQTEEFFSKKLDTGMKKLNLLAGFMYDKIKEGKNIRLQVAGYASALYNEDYNYRLSQRRISSLENYFKNWNDGAMREYFQATDENGNPRIKIERLAIGKSESRSENPEILEEKRRSIYTKEAMEDRRIEIRVLDYK